MNDITMLLQRMKSAASLATQGEWSYARSGFNSIVQVSVSLLRGGPARAVLCKLFRSEWRSELNTAHDAAFIALANPANVMTLIGALEARDKQIAFLKEQLAQLANFNPDWDGLEAATDSLREHMAELNFAQARIAELERMESALRPVGVMSQAAYHRLENRESRFIALWPRPEIYLPRKRPDDGVIVYARTAGIQVIEGEG